MFQFSTPVVLLMLAVFYGGTFLITLLIGKKEENVDGFMVSTGRVGFGISAASMTATWVWAASFYAAATSGYKYGLSGPIHYGLWGALMIFFIYPFGIRFRQLAPEAHTLGELIHARHGRSSQLIMTVANVLGSVTSLMANFTAAGAIIAVMSPLSFVQGVVMAAVGILAYSFWSGFRAAIITDFVQLTAMMLVAAAVIPIIMVAAGGIEDLAGRVSTNLTSEQADFFSSTAILEQGAPFFVAVLAYAVGNQTISQRLFAVRPDRIKATFLTATLGYGAIVIGLGMLGMIAGLVDMQPLGGDLNNIVPQMASTYLPPVFVALFFFLVIASLSSTADSDLAALASVLMTDVYAKNVAKGRPNDRVMLRWGRVTMLLATIGGMLLAGAGVSILTLLVFIGALWGAIVFPVIMSCYWNKVTNTAFSSAVVAAVGLFTFVRFGWLPVSGVLGFVWEVFAAIGGGVVFGLMAFGFLGRRVGLFVGIAAAVVLVPLCTFFLRDYLVLLASLLSYGVSAVVCTAISLTSKTEFDFALISQRVRRFQDEEREILDGSTGTTKEA